MCTCMATIHLHQRGSDDASVDPLVAWLHKDCPPGSAVDAPTHGPLAPHHVVEMQEREKAEVGVPAEDICMSVANIVFYMYMYYMTCV